MNYKDDNDKNNQRIWNLNDVAQRDELKESHLLLLGDKGCGKRTLIQQMNKYLVKSQNKLMEVDKMHSQFAGVDYSFLYIKDLNEKDAISTIVSSDENLPKLNVWTLQDAEKAELLQCVLKPDDLENLCAIIILDFERPWDIMNQLQKWINVLQDTIFQLLPKLPLQLQDKLKQRIENYIKMYEEPELDENGRLIPKIKKQQQSNQNLENGELEQINNEDEEDNIQEIKTQMQLPEGVLKVNLGIPIIVALQKVDLLLRGEMAQYLESNLDFIQKHLRSYCLQYGASIVFTETSQQTNIEVLYSYILHRIYNFDFAKKAEVIAKGQLFIPSGFDSLTQINQLCKGTEEEKMMFEEKMQEPQQQNLQQKTIYHCEEWQSHLQQIWNKKKQGLGPQQSKQDKNSNEITSFYTNLMSKKQPNPNMKRQGTLEGNHKTMPINGANEQMNIIQALKEKHQQKNNN